MAAIGVTSKVHFSYLDHSGERTRTQLHVFPLDDTVGNNAILDDTTGNIALLGTALGLLTRCPQAGTTVSLSMDESSPGIPADAMAQRETAIRWSYSDNVTGKKYRFDTPAPVDAIIPTGSDAVNMAAAAVLAFKAVFEANAVSPDGNDVTLLTGRFVGRRS